jgi:hypothetical protein
MEEFRKKLFYQSLISVRPDRFRSENQWGASDSLDLVCLENTPFLPDVEVLKELIFGWSSGVGDVNKLRSTVKNFCSYHFYKDLVKYERSIQKSGLLTAPSICGEKFVNRFESMVLDELVINGTLITGYRNLKAPH